MTTNNTNIEIRPEIQSYISKVRKYLKGEYKKVKPEWEATIGTLQYNMEMEARIKDKLQEDGLMVKDRYGNWNKHPLLPILNSFQVQILKCINELGISPKAALKNEALAKKNETPKEDDEPNFLQLLNDND